MERFLREIIYGKRNDIISRSISVPLFFFSLLYRMIHFARRFFYITHIFNIKSLPTKVISVGNIALGGVGKSPFVILLAKKLKDKGYKVAILSRGYKRKRRNRIDIVSDEKYILLDPYNAGDEPYMLAKSLQGIPVIVGKNRFKAGTIAIEKFGAEVLILDDGFQHIQLARDLNILLIDAGQLLSNYKLFPVGILREPLKEINRADRIVFSKYSSVLEPQINLLKKKINKNIPFYYSSFEPSELINLNESIKEDVSFLENKKVLAFCGIAEPESFRSTLKSLNVDIKDFFIFPDHHDFSDRDLNYIRNMIRSNNIDLVITTEKDGIRLLRYLPTEFPLWVLRIRTNVIEEKKLEEDLVSLLQD